MTSIVFNIHVEYIHASAFHQQAQDITDPEQSADHRTEFIRVFEEESKRLGLSITSPRARSIPM